MLVPLLASPLRMNFGSEVSKQCPLVFFTGFTKFKFLKKVEFQRNQCLERHKKALALVKWIMRNLN